MSRGSIASMVVVAVIGALVLGYLGSMIFDDGESYSIEYELDGGTLVDPAINTYVSGKSTDLPVAYKDGFTFVGWFTDSKYTEPLGSITKNTRGNLTLYALWYGGSIVGTEHTLSGNGDIIYKVTKYVNGVSTYNIVFKNSTIRYSDDDDKLTYTGNAVVDGYNCAVWKYEDVTAYMYCGIPLKITKGSQSYTAKDVGYDITYELDGGSLPSDAKHKYIWGGEMTLAPAYKEGYYFDGWYTDSYYTQAKVGFTKDDHSFEVHAKWSTESPVGHQYDATFGGTTVSLKAYNYSYGKTYYVMEENKGVKATFWTYSDKTESSVSGSFVKWYVKDYIISYGNDTVKIQKGNDDVTTSHGSFTCLKPSVLVDIQLNVLDASSVEYGMPLKIILDSYAEWMIDSTNETKNSINIEEFIPGTNVMVYSGSVKKVDNSVAISDLGLSDNVVVIDSEGNRESISSSEYKFPEAGEYCFMETGKSYNRFICVESGDIKVFKWDYNGKNYTFSLPMYESDISQYKKDYPMKEIIDNKYSMTDHTRIYLFYEGNDTDESYADYIQRFFCEDKYMTQLVKGLKDLYDKNNVSYSRYDYANYVLHFVGKMEYITDKESTKGMLYPGFEGFDEYYKFPAETLYDMGGDCEDYSILYAALMRASGYDTGVVTLPGHAMAIIALDMDIDGVKFEANGKMYYYCETTNVFDIGKLGQDTTTGATTEVDKVNHRFYLEAVPSTF